MRQTLGDLLEGCAVETFIAAPIAANGRIAADPHEIAQPPHVTGQRRKEALLVISDQKPCIRKLVLEPHGAFDDPVRIGTPIDQIAQQYQRDRCRRAR